MNDFINESQAQAQACVIWMHGLGADASDMMGLTDQLQLSDSLVHHVYINAPRRSVTCNGGMVMPAWYDITGLTLNEREDKQGIEQSELIIRKVIDEQLEAGFTYEQIFLAGFSQGGAMALHTALHLPVRLGGVIALSAYLPLAAHSKPLLDKNTPFFMGTGQFDPLVLPQWSELSKEWLLKHGYHEISYFKYPMEHSICFEEIKDLSLWLVHHTRGDASCPQ